MRLGSMERCAVLDFGKSSYVARDGGSISLPAFAEEVEEEGAGFVFEDAAGDFAAVV